MFVWVILPVFEKRLWLEMRLPPRRKPADCLALERMLYS